MIKLYMFAISHFCEKGRWALDFHGIDYEIEYLAPGLHIAWAKSKGLESTTLPAIETDEGIIQGSAQIIDWADRVSPSGKTLTPADYEQECRAMEQRLDERAGVHTRRMFYAETLLSNPAIVRSNFQRDLTGVKKLVFPLLWPVVQKIMIKKMDIGFEQGVESKAIVEEELVWLNELYSNGRRYLLADQFTRVDLTAASLFSRLTGAEQHPYFQYMKLPPGLNDYAAKWRQEPVIERFRENYRDYR